MDLETPYPLYSDQIQFFRTNGFVKLKNVLSQEVLEHFGPAISAKVFELNPIKLPMAERTTYQKAFIQITNLWQKHKLIHEFVFSRRLARIAAELLGVAGVRLYHDQALFKEAGGGHTPWHADQFYWPLATDKCCTVWIPLQETPLEMGPMAFAARSHRLTYGRDLKISDDSEVKLQSELEKQKLQHVVEPFELGEVSYHFGWTVHRAEPNQTGEERKVMTIIYMDEDMRLKAPDNDYQKVDGEVFCPGIQPGELIDTSLNPVLYRG